MRVGAKRGRPIGSRTFLETPAVKRARKFLENKHAGLKPNAAAKEVAADWQVSESTVFKDYERHLSRLIDAGISEALSQTLRPDLERLVVKAEAAAVTAKRRRQELEIDIGRRFLMNQPEAAGAFARRFFDEFYSVRDRLAEHFDTLGNTTAAQAVRAFNSESVTESDAWLALLGQQYLAILRNSRNKMIR